MKYRFQWNAPIRLSPNNPDVLYTTSQYVHRSTDGGQNWETISPDLTRNDKSKQDYAGVKGITRDDTGVEVYDTIFAFEESPVTPGLLWAGSDDGLLHISRDNGKTLVERSRRRVCPSGHDQRHRPLAARAPAAPSSRCTATCSTTSRRTSIETNDYGETWKRIADGTQRHSDGCRHARGARGSDAGVARTPAPSAACSSRTTTARTGASLQLNLPPCRSWT